MNTAVIDHAGRARGLRQTRIGAASGRMAPLRRFRHLVELSDWDEDILRHSREIDAFCWMLAVGAAVLLIPVSFLVMKG